MQNFQIKVKKKQIIENNRMKIFQIKILKQIIENPPNANFLIKVAKKQ